MNEGIDSIEESNYLKKSLRGENSKRERARAVKTDITSIGPVQLDWTLKSRLLYYCGTKSHRYIKIVRQSKRKLDKELDLQRFLER